MDTKHDTQPLPLAIATQTPSIEDLIARGIDRGITVETMERLLAMRTQLKAESAKEAFDRALAGFQSECPTIAKTKKVFVKGALRYSYAPLESIIEQVKGILKAHGFSYTLDAQVEAGWVTAVCKTTHELGHHETSSFKVPIDKDAYMNEAQKFASALTFAKRYAFCNAFGILTGDEDDDTQTISQPTPAAQPVAKPKPGVLPLPERIKKLRAALGNREEYAVGYLRSFTVEGSDANSALLPNEGLDGLRDEQVEWLSKNWVNFLGRLKTYIESVTDDLPMVPVEAVAPQPDSDEPIGPTELQITGYVKVTTKKETKKAGKFRFGVCVAPDMHSDGIWLNTFSDSDYALASGIKGNKVACTYSEGKYGKELITIQEVT